jgi:hypothetical protein
MFFPSFLKATKQNWPSLGVQRIIGSPTRERNLTYPQISGIYGLRMIEFRELGPTQAPEPGWL